MSCICYLNNQSVKSLAKILSEYKSITHLCFFANDIEDEAAIALVKGLVETNIECLHLKSAHKISDATRAELKQLPFVRI